MTVKCAIQPILVKNEILTLCDRKFTSINVLTWKVRTFRRGYMPHTVTVKSRAVLFPHLASPCCFVGLLKPRVTGQDITCSVKSPRAPI